MSVSTEARRSAAAQQMDVYRLLERLGALPASAMVIRRALDEVREPLCTHERLQTILFADPAVAAELLSTANSAYFAVREEIRNISTAIRVVGLRRLEILLQHMLVGKLLESLGGNSAAASRTHDEAVATAVFAALVAEVAAGAEVEQYRLAGLLHNVGEIAVAGDAPKIYAQAQSARHAGGDGAEADVLGETFAWIAARIIENWGLPEMFAVGAQYAGAPHEAPEEQRTLCRTISLSAVLGRARVARWKPEDALAECPGEAIEALALDEDALHRWYKEAGTEIEALACALR